MEKNTIREYFGRYVNIEDTSWEIFEDIVKLTHYKQGEDIQQPYKHNDKMRFILDGIARSYMLKQDGKDFTWFFHYYKKDATAKQFMLIDYPNFVLQKPSIFGFQALTECKVATLTFQEYQEIMPKVHNSYALENKLTINAYGHTNERLQSLLTKSSREKLKEFEEDYGFLFEEIPHYHIASYLGITPQRLSQLRNM